VAAGGYIFSALWCWRQWKNCQSLIGCLAGCANEQQIGHDVLISRYVGQNVDQMVENFGPPNSTFKMNNGDTAYMWQLFIRDKHQNL
jgi:hypothetical protein